MLQGMLPLKQPPPGLSRWVVASSPLFPHPPSPARLTNYIALLTHLTPLLSGRCCSRLVCALPPQSFLTSHLTPQSQERCQQLFPRPGYHAPWFVLSAFAIPSSITNSRTNTPTLASFFSFFRAVGSSSFHLLLLHLPFPNRIVPLV